MSATADSYFVLLGQYNHWMNDKLYRAAQALTAEQLAADQGAFFSSVLGTLNHIMVADIMWLKRFARHPGQMEVLAPVVALPQPKALDEILHADIETWWPARKQLDDVITQWCGGLSQWDTQQPLAYTNRKGEAYRKQLGMLIMHMFNHQTHHRGQASTLFHQLGVDIGPTDLVIIAPDVEHIHQEENHHV